MDAKFLPYGHQIVDDEDIAAVVKVLQSDWLTTGSFVEQFEEALCRYVDAQYGVAVSSGTAALHSAMAALEIGAGDEVIVPPLTFAATANCVLYQGGKPVFADVDEETLLINPQKVEEAITSRTKAIIGVDYAGQPCQWDALRKIAEKYHLALVADSCHALGATWQGRKVGTLADITCFSFHPVKHITTGEGGMAVTHDEHLARRMRIFRSHGIETTASQREKSGQWYYEMTSLGWNYRLTDFQCALGISQLQKQEKHLQRRRALAAQYGKALNDPEWGGKIRPLQICREAEHAWHLYVVRHPDRDSAFSSMRKAGIGVNVHYVPVHLHPFYRQMFGTGEGLCPVAEAAYEEILTLPLWPGMTDNDVKRVLNALKNTLR